MAKSILPTSDFYNACRDNDINSVKSLLQTMTPDRIDKLEPNNSTALHTASYNGHYEIVKLLLEKGASTSIKNRYNLTPYEEGKTDEIRKLFLRKDDNEKFVGDLDNTLKWIKVGEDIDQEAKSIRKMLKTYADQSKKKSKKIQIEMIDLGNYPNIEKIQWYFDQANKKNDPTYILKAYTEETEFYQRLNRALARAHEPNPTDPNQHQLLDFLQLICCHSSFQKYEYQGETYRGMIMNDDDFNQYEIGAKFMTRSLLSTSKLRNIAEKFANKKQVYTNGNTMEKSCICKYKIRKEHTALSIQELSAFPHEQEVLIIPYSAFQVVNIKTISTEHGSITEIELRQCKSYIQTYTAIAVGGGLLATAAGALVKFFIDDDDDDEN